MLLCFFRGDCFGGGDAPVGFFGDFFDVDDFFVELFEIVLLRFL